MAAGGGQVPGRHRDVPEPFMADRQVVLPLGVAGVSSGQPQADVEAGLVGGAGCGQVPGRHRDVPEPVVEDRQVALPPGVGGIGDGGSLDVLVDGLQLPGGCGQVAGAEQGPDFEVGDDSPGPLGGGMSGRISARQATVARVPGRTCTAWSARSAMSS